MKRKKKHMKLKTQEHPRHKLQTFKVRCSQEMAFYAFVEAHNAAEAEIVAEDHCREHCFWESEATYRHSTFEAEET